MCHMQHMPFPGRWLSERFCSARMGVAVWGFLSILLCSWCDRFKIFLVVGRKQPGLTFKQICAETSVWVQVPLCHLSIPGWLKLSLMGLQSWFPHFAVFEAQGAWTSLLSAAGRCSSLCSSFWALNLRLDRLLGALCRLWGEGTMSTSELWWPRVHLPSATCIAVRCQFTETLCRYLPVLVTICLSDQWWEHSALDLYCAYSDFALQTYVQVRLLLALPNTSRIFMCLTSSWAGIGNV